METAKDLNFGSDEMQVVLTALHDVGRRIKEVGETHKPLFGGEHFLTGRRYVNGCISVLEHCKIIEIRGLYLIRNLQGRYSIRLRTWRGYWKSITRYNNKKHLTNIAC